jgi:two-component system NarL family sensor kinase
MTDGWLSRLPAEHGQALLLGMAETLSAPADLPRLAGAVARLVLRAVAADVCLVHVLDDDGRALTLAGATPPFDDLAGTVRLRVGEGVTGWVAAHRRPAVIVADKRADSRYKFLPELRGDDYTSMASVPMVTDQAGLVGVLNVHSAVRREYGAADLDLLSGLGRLAAGAVGVGRLHRQLALRQAAQERLGADLVAVQERERARLAGDIHDGVSQRIVSLSFHLAAAAEQLGGTDGFVTEQLRVARELADLALAEAKAAVQGLRPPVLDDLGLAPALRGLGHGVAPGLSVQVSVDDVALPEHLQVVVYRVVQEALQNVAKHARATSAAVSVRGSAREIVVRVVDDGCGLPPDPGGSGFGLASMRERAEAMGGSLRLTSRPGRGTILQIRLPWSSA